MSMTVLATRHAQALLGSLGRLSRQPLASALTLLVIALALTLPAALKLVVSNAQQATGGFGAALDMSVYLRTDVPLTKAEQLARNARARSDIAAVTLIPAEQALAEFRGYSGFGAALDALQQNPLPHVLRIRPRIAADSAPGATLESLRGYFAAWPEVDLVQIDSDWAMRFNAMVELLRRVALLAASLLGAGVIAIIGNTIRLEILNRRAEIEVTKLVGGSNAYVRRPFLYTGALYGLMGALLAWAIISGAVLMLSGSVQALARLYGSGFALKGLDLAEGMTLIGGGALLGLVGAWLAASRHVRSIEPRA